MAKITVDGKEYQIDELNFIAVEYAWPYIQKAMTSQDVMKGVAAGIYVIAAGLSQSDGFDAADFGSDNSLPDDVVINAVSYFLKKNFKAKEIGQVSSVVTQIIKEAGLEPEQGEAVPDQAIPGMGTSIQSSPNLSPPDAKEEIGIA